ncbi:hypothetical protein [Nisaea nitritireducens]|uniref:hypothetical protein n=1 Tax=Nisaea nitritireducens TaxID=568392 RepID=UPI0018678A88|nr:hypothetical protein [Nisaea nitritireducens]
MRESRAQIFSALGDNNNRFPHFVYFQPVPKRREIDYISVVLDVEWPSNKGGPLLFKEIEDAKEKIPIFNLIYSLKSFLERTLIAELELIEIRTGCINVVFHIKDPVPHVSLVAGLDRLLDNKERYRAFDVSARLGNRRVY